VGGCLLEGLGVVTESVAEVQAEAEKLVEEELEDADVAAASVDSGTEDWSDSVAEVFVDSEVVVDSEAVVD